MPLGPPIEVPTVEGVVRGVTEGAVHVFRGIPYGAPVDGARRWLPPRPPAKRDGVFDARAYGPACEQTVASIPTWMLTEAGEVALYEMSDLDAFNAEQKSGDCLRLNIWTPARLPVVVEASPPASQLAPRGADVPLDGGTMASSDSEGSDAGLARDEGVEATLDVGVGVAVGASVDTIVDGRVLDDVPETTGLPVIVHLHGGGLTSGSAVHKAQDGAILASKGVVFVSINYRLGSIGFLAGEGLFDDDTLIGNRGFMDTVRALEWIKDNIAQFGGDPANVTLMGQSGGGTNVWSVLASPTSKGLVRRAIIMSGPIYDYPAADHRKLSEAVLSAWKVPPGDKEALARVSAEDAASTVATTTLVGSDEFGTLSRTYLPSAGASGTAFLPHDILTAVEKGALDHVDLLVGNCDDDAKISIIMVPIPDFFAIDIWNGYIGGLVADDDEGFDAMTKKYIDALPHLSATRAKEQLQTDALYRVRALKAAAAHSARTSDAALGRTFTYQFSWKSPTFPDDLGAMHGLDLIFALGNLTGFPRALGIEGHRVPPSTAQLSEQMQDAWVSFARTGAPSSETLPPWPEYEAGARQTMVFDTESTVVSDPGGVTRKLWD